MNYLQTSLDVTSRCAQFVSKYVINITIHALASSFNSKISPVHYVVNAVGIVCLADPFSILACKDIHSLIKLLSKWGYEIFICLIAHKI